MGCAARCLASGLVPVDAKVFAEIRAMATGQLPLQAAKTPAPGTRMKGTAQAAAQGTMKPLAASGNSSPDPASAPDNSSVAKPGVASSAPGVQLEERLSHDLPLETSVPGSNAAGGMAGSGVPGPPVAQDATGAQFEEIFPDAQHHQGHISEDNVHQVGPASTPGSASAACWSVCSVNTSPAVRQ